MGNPEENFRTPITFSSMDNSCSSCFSRCLYAIIAAARVSPVACTPFTSIHFVFFSVLDRTCEGAVTATGFPGNRSGLDALPDLTSGSSSCESRNLYIYIYAICLCQVLVNLLLGILPRHTKTDNGRCWTCNRGVCLMLPRKSSVVTDSL